MLAKATGKCFDSAFDLKCTSHRFDPSRISYELSVVPSPTIRKSHDGNSCCNQGLYLARPPCLSI